MTSRETPLLLTPGPLTTALRTREAMLRDWGSRDTAFVELSERIRNRILAIAEAQATHVCVPLQGSGTFVVEATLGTLIPAGGKVLVLVNGAYGSRIATICRILSIEHRVLEWDEIEPVDGARVAAVLATDRQLTHVAVAQCETTSGILNPVAEIASVVTHAGRSLIVDAMSAFGAIELSATRVPFDALIASSNKCLEGVPGIGFAIVRRKALEDACGNARSLSLDLYDQWRVMEANGQWRFTPPTHVLAALDVALDAHSDEGGVVGRGIRYRRNCEVLIRGMRALGFQTLVADDLQAPIIVSFATPRDTRFDFASFYRRLADRGFLIYPGKLTDRSAFRIGCIGHLNSADMQEVVRSVGEVLNEMGVEDGAP